MEKGWKGAAFIVGLAAGTGAIWLKYKFGMSVRYAAIVMLGVIGGPFVVLYSICCSEGWLRTNEQSKRLVEKVGVGLTRLLYALFGLTLIGVGVWFLSDHFREG